MIRTRTSLYCWLHKVSWEHFLYSVNKVSLLILLLLNVRLFIFLGPKGPNLEDKCLISRLDSLASVVYFERITGSETRDSRLTLRRGEESAESQRLVFCLLSSISGLNCDPVRRRQTLFPLTGRATGDGNFRTPISL